MTENRNAVVFILQPGLGMVYEVIESKFGSPRSVTVYAEENQPAVTGKYQILKLVFL